MSVFKPGDVAMMTWSSNVEGPFVVVRGHGRWHMLEDVEASRDSPEFLRDDWLGERAGVSIRPLVVIDPEDEEQVERLTETLWSFLPEDLGPYRAGYVARTQDALRSLANPKPAEPTGLGAVVEDSRGRRWVRTEPHPSDHGNPWVPTFTNQPGSIAFTGFWDDIDAVRVVSEGIQ